MCDSNGMGMTLAGPDFRVSVLCVCFRFQGRNHGTIKCSWFPCFLLLKNYTVFKDFGRVKITWSVLLSVVDAAPVRTPAQHHRCSLKSSWKQTAYREKLPWRLGALVYLWEDIYAKLISVLCRFKCMYIYTAFCRVRATGGTRIAPHLPSGEQVISKCLLWYQGWCVGTSVSLWPAQFIGWGIPVVEESRGNFTHAAYLEIVSICFSLSHHVTFSYRSGVWWVFLWVKSSLSACNDRSTGIFLSFPPQNLFHRQGELVLTTNFLLQKGVCFHSYFQSAAAVPIAMAKGIQFSAWPLGNSYQKLFSMVNIPELLLPLPAKDLLWSQMCRCFTFNVCFEDHLLLHFHYPLGFHISWTPYSPSCSDQAPTGALGCGGWKGEQLHAFSCVYIVLGSLAYQHRSYKGNTKCCQT